ncbi:MAG: hypothetical protein ACQETO_05235 [Pseudomonadota bacterium]
MSEDRSSCDRTAQVMADHLGNPPGSEAARAAFRHIAGCQFCQVELASLEPVVGTLAQWRDQPVPDWNRHPQGRPDIRVVWRRAWQWGPLAASVVLAVAMLFHLQFQQERMNALEARWEQALVDSQQQVAGMTADQLEAVVHWVEQQREADLRMLEASFEQMLAREYETARSVRQLAGYIQYQQP